MASFLLHSVLVVATLATLAQRCGTFFPGRRIRAVTQLNPLVRFTHERLACRGESRRIGPYVGSGICPYTGIRTSSRGKPVIDGTGRLRYLGRSFADLRGIRRVALQLIANDLEGRSQALQALLTGLDQIRGRSARTGRLAGAGSPVRHGELALRK